MYWPRSSRIQGAISAPSSRTWPRVGSHSPTSSLISDVLPAALGPTRASTWPGSALKLRLNTIGRLAVVGWAISSATSSTPLGAGSGMRSDTTSSSATMAFRRSSDCLAVWMLDQLPMICLMGPMARLSKKLAAITMPPVIRPSMASQHASAICSDGMAWLRKLVAPPTRPADSLALTCSPRKCWCFSNQRRRMVPCMPSASAVSDWRRLCAASRLASAEAVLASRNAGVVMRLVE